MPSQRIFQLHIAVLKGATRVGMCVEGREARGLEKVEAQTCVYRTVIISVIC